MGISYGFWIGAALAVAGATTASAETALRSASAFGPKHIQATAVFDTLNAQISELTDGDYTVRDFPSGLAGPSEMITALRDSVVDIGSVILSYFPADFADSTIPSNLSIFGSNPVAIANATTEYIVTCVECQAEFRDLGQVYLGSGWTPAFQLQTTRPVVALDDMKGVRLRVAGALFSEWAEYMGAQPVQMPSSEIFQAMSEGTVDGFFGNLPDMKIQQIDAYVTDILMVNFGTFNGDSISVRSGVWADLSAQDREAFVRAAMAAREAGGDAWSATNETAAAEAREKGIVFHDPDAEIQAKLDGFRDFQLNALTEKLAADGVKDGPAKIDRYLKLVEKWEDLLADAGDSPEALIDLKMQEIWSGVDFASYGQ